MNNPIIEVDTVNADSLQLPIEQFRNLTSLGIVNTIPDDDGISRKSPININIQKKQYTNFSLALMKIYYHGDQNKLIQLSHIPLEHGLIRINFNTLPDSFQQYSFVDVLNNKVPLNVFSNKIVLIGATAPDLHDTQLTPISNGVPMNGVMIHANTIQTIDSQKYLHSESIFSTITAILVLSFCMLFIFTFSRVIAATIFSFLLSVIFILYVFISFDNGVIRNIIYPLLTIISIYILQLIYNYFVENKQRRYLRRAFSYYVPEAVLKDILSDPSKLTLGGAKKKYYRAFFRYRGFYHHGGKIRTGSTH